MLKILSYFAFFIVSTESEIIPAKLIQFIGDFDKALKEYRLSLETEKALLKKFRDDSELNKDNATATYLSISKEMYLVHEDLRAEFESIERVFNQTHQQDLQKVEMNFPVDQNFIRINVEKLKDVNKKIQKQMGHLCDEAVLKLKPIKNILSYTGRKLAQLGSLFQTAGNIFKNEELATKNSSLGSKLY